MITETMDPNSRIVTFEMVGKVTKNDYQQNLIPTMKRAKENDEKVICLIHFGEEFEGFSTAAAWEDFKLSFNYMNTFSRIAVVTDRGWLKNISKFIGSLLPCSVEVFEDRDLERARNWLISGDQTFIYTLDKVTGVLTIELTDELSSDIFNSMVVDVDQWIKENGELRAILIHSREFPGWKDVGSFISHFKFVKNHHSFIRKVALVTDSSFAELIPKVSSHFVNAKVRLFPYIEINEARDWLINEKLDESSLSA